MPGRSAQSLAMRNALSRTLWFCLAAAVMVIVYHAFALRPGEFARGWRSVILASVSASFLAFGLPSFLGFLLAGRHLVRRWEASTLGAATGLAATWRPRQVLWEIPDELVLPFWLLVVFAVAAIGGGALRRWSHGSWPLNLRR